MISIPGDVGISHFKNALKNGFSLIIAYNHTLESYVKFGQWKVYFKKKLRFFVFWLWLSLNIGFILTCDPNKQASHKMNFHFYWHLKCMILNNPIVSEMQLRMSMVFDIVNDHFLLNCEGYRHIRCLSINSQQCLMYFIQISLWHHGRHLLTVPIRTWTRVYIGTALCMLLQDLSFLIYLIILQ